jgi:hypothetical protein
MTERATRALEFADDFERTDDGFEATHATFETTVGVGGDGCRVVVVLPTLDAAVVEESVPDVIEDGWFETLERRLDGVEGVTGSADVTEPTIERGEDAVVVEVGFSGGDAAAAAKAVVNYVEGTWFEGVIPGYDYVETVQSVREQAHQQGSSGR